MLYPEFYTKYGVKDFTKFKTPKFYPINTLTIPKACLLHVNDHDATGEGPDQDSPLFNKRDSSHVWHVEELLSPIGSPRHRPTEVRSRIKGFHKRNRKLRQLRKFEQGIRDDNNLVVVNYALLKYSYRYQRSLLSDWNAWVNINSTAWNTLAKMAKDTMRYQFVEFVIPRVIPLMDDLIALKKKRTLDSLEPFADYTAFDVYYLWEYCTEGTHSLDLLLGDKIHLVNLVFINGGKFTVLNLGKLQEWKRTKLKEDEVQVNGEIDKTLLRFITQVQELATLSPELEESDDDIDIDTPIAVNGSESGIEASARELMAGGSLSLPEYKRTIKQASRYKSLPATNGQATLADQVRVSQKDLIIPTTSDGEGIIESMDKNYVATVMEKDIAAMALSVQNANVSLTNFTATDVEDAANNYTHYTMQFTPLGGSPSTVHVKLPKVDPQGKFFANGVTYYMAKQRGDLPIRKTKPASVSLTSYYGKLFVTRSDRSVYNQADWATNKIIELGLDDNSDIVTNLRQGEWQNPTLKLPLLYTGIAKRVLTFKCVSGDMVFDYTEREALYDKQTLKTFEKRGHVVCGSDGKRFITVDVAGTFYYRTQDGTDDVIGGLSELLGTSLGRIPKMMAALKLYNVHMPVGVILGYYHGLDTLLRKLNVKHRFIPKGQRFELEGNEDSITFKDETLVYDTSNPETVLILHGFYEYRNAVKTYLRRNFNKKDVYLPVFESRGVGARFLRELDLLKSMFIDPITDGILEARKEPRTFSGLLFKSVELLKDDRTPAETDPEFMRLKGYERMPGFIYKELVAAVRRQQASPMTAKSKVEVNPKAVWLSIIKDATTKPVDQLNPLGNLKERELVTYTGDGGRTARAMTAKSRLYHKNDVGVISEATVDSSSVGINTYLTANPNLQDMRGTLGKKAANELSAENLISTSSMLAPAATMDDPKRANFISIQNSHMVACDNYTPMPLITGYDDTLARRSDPMFSVNAPQDGVVIDISDSHMEIRLKDGSSEFVELGTIYGSVNGTRVPHRLETDLAKNAKFKQGDVIAWNRGFFTRDALRPGKVRFKGGTLVNVALIESVDTLEDSCAISEKLAGELSTETTAVRNIFVTFDQEVKNLVRVGDYMELETILCTLADPVSVAAAGTPNDNLESLRALGNINPRAKYNGVIEKIEVIYNGEKEDLSESLKAIVAKADRGRAATNSQLNRKGAKTGRIVDPINIDGRRVVLDTVVIKVYITKSITAGVGDKGVLGNQLKTIIGRVMTGENKTESGEPIDLHFGRQSISARIVNSPDIMGTTNKLLQVLSKSVADKYFSK